MDLTGRPPRHLRRCDVPVGRRRSRIAAAIPVACILAAALAGTGCSALGIGSSGDSSSARLSEQELAERLARFSDLYAQSITEGVRVLTEGDVDAELDRAALVWQIQSIRACRNSVLASDPQVAFTDVWVLCVQQRLAFESDAYTKRTGARGETLAAAGRNLEAAIIRIGAEFLQPAELERARTDVEAFARASPIGEGFTRETALPSGAATPAAMNLDWVTSVPMAPFRFVTGVDEVALSVHHLSEVAQRAARRVDALPQETLWELQLLLHDIEQQPVVQRTVAAVESAAKTGESVAATARDFQATADRIATTAAAIPADLRKEADGLLADFDARQGELRGTIAELRRALTEAREVADRANAFVADAKSAGTGFDATAKSVGEAARALESALKAYQTMMREIHPPSDPAAPPPPPDAKPFDVLEWQRTADSIAKAAAELRGTLTELHAVAKDGSLGEHATAAAATARAELQTAIDHAFVRALQLAAAIAVLVVVLRLVKPRPRAAPPGDDGRARTVGT